MSNPLMAPLQRGRHADGTPVCGRKGLVLRLPHPETEGKTITVIPKGLAPEAHEGLVVTVHRESLIQRGPVWLATVVKEVHS